MNNGGESKNIYLSRSKLDLAGGLGYLPPEPAPLLIHEKCKWLNVSWYMYCEKCYAILYVKMYKLVIHVQDFYTRKVHVFSSQSHDTLLYFIWKKFYILTWKRHFNKYHGLIFYLCIDVWHCMSCNLVVLLAWCF